ncbi:SDR family NAD(P)-dependent oxidoreductase [Pseudomonas sp. SDT2931_S440]|jgi:3-oxoacyl-[acyl-carrier protein] reductase|uniref:SDR family NAD(P)-dependent oxidoreductase n=1 Tax=unclassified Pseudomonas TaxID=196821 RepID=UPI0015A099C1|nr:MULTISPECIES: glucose 1-dehydrogenase [unclassified Pseudomonas]NVZ42362.1 glucose 1-dehydrogenase [Pseudomonas sp. 21615526]NVZ95890.1 glucose 1-dehydrogenase [Pseudomonas sp. B6001]NWA34977.1 glucose 1-dehydrogenase [Pseudomonas sp. C6002]NWB14606.1 glucose 1-dehydrogenase [Pseudomonas sp. D6002]NWB60820.1 glucose 1-dehydrogenase [Pseudomonas sp. F1002]
MKLDGKIAVVTGASKGIGAGIAKALGAAGATVVVNYSSSKAEADGVVAQIQADGGNAMSVRADMSLAADVIQLFDTIRSEYGRLDILVNNAGVAVFQMIEDLTEEAFHRQFNLNVLGYLLAAREAVKLFGQGGSIINISSILSTDPYLASSVYSATKGAVDTLTFALARELGPKGIRVNSILPGHTNTPATAGNFAGEFGQQLIAGTPLGRFGEPDDIAPVAVFLASDDAHWVTGESIRVSGGVRGVGY